MLNRIYILSCFICMTFIAKSQHLQLVENRGEIGIMAGESAYFGDIAPNLVFYKYSYGAYYKKQFNDYGGIRFSYEKIQIGANDTLSNSIYQKNRGFAFTRNFHDLSLIGEFYFTRFLPGNKTYRFTPYLGFGVGYLIPAGNGIKEIFFVSNKLAANYVDSASYPETTTTKGFINFPIQLGFKYNINRRWNIQAEAMYRFVNSDELDFFSDKQLLNQYNSIVPSNQFTYQGSRSGKDQFLSLKVGLSYNLIKIYGEEKWKPGKKSKLASMREKERATNQNKPGFFSRLKFKRN